MKDDLMAMVNAMVDRILDDSEPSEDMMTTLWNLKLLCRELGGRGGLPKGSRLGIEISTEEIGRVTFTVKRSDAKWPLVSHLGDHDHDDPADLRPMVRALINAAVAMRERECPCN